MHTKSIGIRSATAALFCLQLLAGCCDCADEPKPAANVTRTAAQPTMVDPKSVFGKIRVVSIGEDYKVRVVGIGESLRVRKVSIGADRPGLWQMVTIGEDYKIRYVSIGEDFTIRFVSIGDGFAMERVD